MRSVGRTKSDAARWAKACAAALFLMFCVSSQGSPSTRPLLSEGELTCTLKVEDDTIALGEAPTLHVRLKNNSVPMLLIGSLDGTDGGYRYPLCRMEIRYQDGEIVDKPFSHCGNQNSLRREDFVEVGAGETFDPYMRIDDYGFFSNYKIRPENFDRPGTYTIQFTYSTMAEDFERYSPGPELNGPGTGHDLLAKVPRVHVVSNVVTVAVVDEAN